MEYEKYGKYGPMDSLGTRGKTASHDDHAIGKGEQRATNSLGARKRPIIPILRKEK